MRASVLCFVSSITDSACVFFYRRLFFFFVFSSLFSVAFCHFVISCTMVAYSSVILGCTCVFNALEICHPYPLCVYAWAHERSLNRSLQRFIQTSSYWKIFHSFIWHDATAFNFLMYSMKRKSQTAWFLLFFALYGGVRRWYAHQQ